MNEASPADQPSDTVPSPGQLLRAAREAKGLQVAELAASIRVPAGKIELLEADQWEALPDMAFARALALTVCRSLAIDPGAIVSGLPQAHTHSIEQVTQGINKPFRDRSAGSGHWWASLGHPLTWLAVLVLLAAGFLHQLPAYWLDLAAQMQPSERPPEAPVEPSSLVSPALEAPEATKAAEQVSAPTVEPSRPSMPDVADSDPLAELLVSLEAKSASRQPLEVRVKAPSWIKVQDASGKIVFNRVLQPGPEPVTIGGLEPLKLRIGNAVATEVTYRGRLVDLTTFTRGNVARLDLN